MGHASSALLGVGNRPRQGRAVLEILAMIYVMRKLGAGTQAEAAGKAHAYTRAVERRPSTSRGGASPPPPADSSSPAAVSSLASTHTSSGSRRNSLTSYSSSSLVAPSSAPTLPPPVISGIARVDLLLSRWNARLRRYTPLQLLLGVLIGTHIWSNLSLLLGLNAPHHSLSMEPDMHYSKSFSQARWLLTSLDAATLSTLKVKIAPLRHALMIILAGYYALNFRRAENQVEAFRRSMSHHAIRACWEKGGTPILAAVDRLTRKRCLIELELVQVRSPDGHDIECRLFYNKSREELQHEKSMLLDFPGGGFISMSPHHHADYLSFWAMELGIPVLSVNYRKAPEFPFPCGFEDAWHVYKAVVDTNGGLLGMNVGPSASSAPIRIAVAGDSAGGNFACAVTIQAITRGVRLPSGLLLIYPCLDLASTNFWRESSLTPRDHEVKARPWARRTEAEIQMLVARQAGAAKAAMAGGADATTAPNDALAVRGEDALVEYAPPQLSSRAQYTQDGVLPLKYMQLIASCYFGNGGDPVSNPLISPAIASDAVLAQFPPIWAHVGSVDPLVDDVLRFGARVQQANPQHAQVQICVIPKVSHAYMHVVNFLPEAKLARDLSACWIAQICERPPPTQLAEGIQQRMDELKCTLTDCKEYKLTQPQSVKQVRQAAAAAKEKEEAAAAADATPLVSKL